MSKEDSNQMLMTDWWFVVCFFFPSLFCSYFSSSHFGFSSRAEKLCWCTWGQLHWERSRGKHYLHYSRLERIYVQYLAFGTHAQVTTMFIRNLVTHFICGYCPSKYKRFQVDSVQLLRGLITWMLLEIHLWLLVLVWKMVRTWQKLDNAIITLINS